MYLNVERIARVFMIQRPIQLVQLHEPRDVVSAVWKLIEQS